MRNHPAYSERPQGPAAAPRDEPYVPFGVGEVMGWSFKDINGLPNLQRQDLPGWRFVVSYAIGDQDLDALREKLAEWCVSDEVYGLGLHRSTLSYDRVTVWAPKQ